MIVRLHFSVLIFCLALGSLTVGPNLRGADVVSEKMDAFLAEHCYDCHDDSVSKGDLNLLDLPFKLDDPANFELWARVFERVESGEMPPEKKPRPEENDVKTFIAELEAPLHHADRERITSEGRSKVRRLTRREYENTINDLLGINIPIVDFLPEDPVGHIFETIASDQQISHHLLSRYLEAADEALTEAFARATKGDKKYSKTVGAYNLGKGAHRGGNYRGPENKEGHVIYWPMPLQFYGRTPGTVVPESGWYRIKLNGVQAVNTDVIWATLKSGACASNAPMLYQIDLIEATRKKQSFVYEAWIQKRHMLELKPADVTTPRAKLKSQGGNVSYKGSDLEKTGTHGIAVSSIELERIYPDADLTTLKKRIFGNLNKKQIEEATPDELKKLIGDQVHRFANRAFRRPVTREQSKPYVEIATTILDEKDSKPVDALYNAYRAILCSPRFLTFYEKTGTLDQHALANRLSYMVWSSMPDDELSGICDKGEFKGQVVHEQLTRMLANPKANRFYTNFTDQWLKLSEIDFTTPDPRRFRTFDQVVHYSLLDETRSFVKELIKSNLPIQNFIHSDFAMLNERLKRFYNMEKLPVQKGGGLQKVSLEGNARGGLVTQGAILKVTADGSITSPIIRGVYMNERILGIEVPPPPPGIPAVEPDIRGAVSIRDQLDKHRNNESCAACHQKIDPAGFALENFDPVGLWRTQYGNKKSSAKVDPSGETPCGKPFAGIQQWKKVYVNKPEQLTESFARNVLTYSTGAEPGFSDREALEKIVHASREKGWGVRSILHSVISSEPFRTK